MRWGGSSPSPGTGGSVVTPAVQTIQLTKNSLVVDTQKDIPIGSSTTVAVDLAPSNFTSSAATDHKVSGDFTVTCNGIKQASLTGTWVVAATASSATSFAATSSVSFTGTPNAATCAIAGNVTATRGSVVSNTLPITATFTTVAAPAAWWPPTFIPQGVKNFLDKAQATPGAVVNATYPGQTQSGLLPPACRTTGNDCWKGAVRNGTISFVSTTAVNQLQPTRAIVFGFYKTVDAIFFPDQKRMIYCIKTFFADDGTLVNKDRPVEDLGCNTWEYTYQMGNALGEILQAKDPTTGAISCAQTRNVLNPDKVSGGWANTDTPCP